MTASVAAPVVPRLVALHGDESPQPPQGSRFLRNLLTGLDAASLTAAAVVSELLLAPRARSLLVAVAFVVVFAGTGIFVYGALGLYRARVCSLRSIEHTRMARAAVVLAMAGLAAVALLHGLVTNKEVFVAAAVALTLSVLTRAGYRNWLAGRRRDGDFLRPVVLVGCGEGSVEINSLLECHPELGYSPLGVIGDPEIAERFGQRWCGSLDEVAEALEAAGATGALVCTTALDPEELNRVVQDLLNAGAHVQLSTGLRGVDIQRLRPLPLAHEPFFYVEPVRLARWQLVLKRALDLVIAGAVLLVTAPVIGLAALGIKLEDGGPIFFRQVRVGRDGQRFVLYKLRTMRVGAESELLALRERNVRDGPLLKIPDDPRVRTLGRLLRATSIDELPQLWNVLNGTMSLVGPRPALPDEVAQFDEELRAREAVAPGITGLWQVEARDNPSFLAYRRFDLFYLQNWSVGLDLMILCSTAEAIVTRLLRMLRHSTPDIQVSKRQSPPVQLEPAGVTTPRHESRPHTAGSHDRAGRGSFETVG
jgi:exopolysaccharide biosynthesis polyprenyl glycosylphosphotransferase